MYGMIGSLINTVGNIALGDATNKQNQKNFDANQNWSFADMRTSNAMLNNYVKTGEVEPVYVHQDYGDVADMLNPYLALSSNKLQKQAMKLNEEQFKYSKYVTENSAQIKAKDYEKAGFSPLLAVGGGASYSPVSTGSSGATSTPKTPRQNPNTQQMYQAFALNTALAKEKAEVDVLKAQEKKINAETQTELERPSNITADTKLKENQSIKVTEETKYVKEQINSELLKQGLTKKQIEYYDAQVATLQHNLEESIKNGIRTTDQMPFVFSEIQNILQAMGVNPDSNLGQFLTAGTYALLMYSGARVKAPTVNKYNNNTTNYIKK